MYFPRVRKANSEHNGYTLKKDFYSCVYQFEGLLTCVNEGGLYGLSGLSCRFVSVYRITQMRTEGDGEVRSSLLKRGTLCRPSVKGSAASPACMQMKISPFVYM